MKLFVVGQLTADRSQWYNQGFTRYSIVLAESPEKAREAAFSVRPEYMFRKVDGIVPVAELPFYILATEQGVELE